MRNYRHAVDNFFLWLQGDADRESDQAISVQDLQAMQFGRKTIRDFVIEQQRRVSRRTL
ncbi:uncharacterized protein METZ01_LOCUS357961, partial [marine metagenome]